MEKIYDNSNEGNAFITAPNLKQKSKSNRALSDCCHDLSDKILKIIDSFFYQKDIIAQAILNLAIPKHFIDKNFVKTRTDESQLQKVYSAVLMLRKQLAKISIFREKKQSGSPKICEQPFRNDFRGNGDDIQDKSLHKRSRINRKSAIDTIKRIKSNRQAISHQNVNKVTPDQRIKQAILRQLAIRKQLQNTDEKIQSCQEKKASILEKKKQAAKYLNKKAFEVSKKMKQKQNKQIAERIKTFVMNNQVQQNYRAFSLNSTVRSEHSHQINQRVRNKIQMNDNNLLRYLQNQQMRRQAKMEEIRSKKWQQALATSEKAFRKDVKSQKIRRKKMNTIQLENYKILKEVVQKQEHKLKVAKKSKTNLLATMSTNLGSRAQRKHSSQMNSTMKTNMSHLRATLSKKNQNSQFQKGEQKQNLIAQRLQEKNMIREELLNEKVQKLRRKRKAFQQKRKRQKQVQQNNILAIQQQNEYQTSLNKGIISGNYKDKDLYNESSIINHHSPFNFSQIQQNQRNKQQQQKIKQEHIRLVESRRAEDEIIGLKKLPTYKLQKYF